MIGFGLLVIGNLLYNEMLPFGRKKDPVMKDKV
jgi:hypothetical protein